MCPEAAEQTRSLDLNFRCTELRGVGKPCSFKANQRVEFVLHSRRAGDGGGRGLVPVHL